MNARETGSVVAVCRECGGWVAVMTEECEERGGETPRDFYRTVAKLHLDVRRVATEEFRTGAFEVCHRYKKPKKVAEQIEAPL